MDAGKAPSSAPPDGPSSIYSYQTRLMRNPTDSTSTLAGGRVVSVREDTTVAGLRRSGSGARQSHNRGKSIDVVRGQWEKKIEEASGPDEASPSARRRPKSVLEPKQPSPTKASSVAPPASLSQVASSRAGNVTPSNPTLPDPVDVPASTPPAKLEKAAASPAIVFPGADEEELAPPKTSFDEFGLQPRLHLSSLTGLSSDLTGNSTMRSNRSAADTLAEARANALRRLEARKAAGMPVAEPKVDLPPLPVAKELDLPPLPILDVAGMPKATPTRLSKLLPKKSISDLAQAQSVPASTASVEIKGGAAEESPAPLRQRLKSIPRAAPVPENKDEQAPSPAPLRQRLRSIPRERQSPQKERPTTPETPKTPPAAVKRDARENKEQEVATNAPTTQSHRERLKSVPRPTELSPPAETKTPVFPSFAERRLRPVSMVESPTERTLPPTPSPATPPTLSHRDRLKSIPRAPVEAASPVESRPAFAEKRLRPVSMIETGSPKAEPPVSLVPAETATQVEPSLKKKKSSVLGRVQAFNQPSPPRVTDTPRVPSKDDSSVLRRAQSINTLPKQVQTSRPVVIPGRDAGDIRNRVQNIDTAPEVVQTSKPVSLPGREAGHIHKRIQSIDQAPDIVQTSKPVHIPGRDAGHIHKRIQSIDQLPETVQTSKPVVIPGRESGHIHRRIQSIDQAPGVPKLRDAPRVSSREEDSAVLRKVKSINQLPTAPQTSKPVVIPGREAGSLHKRIQGIDHDQQFDRLESATPSGTNSAPHKARSFNDVRPSETATPRALPKGPLTPSRPQMGPAGGDVFSPTKPVDSPSSTKPKSSGLGFRAPKGPPKVGSVSSMANRWAAGDVPGIQPSRGRRVPSLSSDRRQLGKHLPRIVSGDQGWDGDGSPGPSRVPSTATRTRKTSLSRSVVPPESVEENTPPRARTISTSTVIEHPSPISTSNTGSSQRQPLSPASQNREPPSRGPSTPRRQMSKSGNHLNLVTPRAEVVGAEMKGLMSAVGAASARAPDTSSKDAAAGMPNRLRLSSRLPLAASSAAMAPAPLPSRRLAAQNNWMDRQRQDLAAYEYLCHVGEAQQWIEGCLDEELGFGVTEMEQGLRDGVVLAKLAREFQGEEVVRRIWTEAKHRFRQSDNINYFINFVRTVGMPETFVFELTDLYNAKNIPKVIFCIHVLSILLARLGRAERMNNLVGQFEFTDEQLAATEKGIQGVAMPNFGQVGQTLAKEASWEEPEEEIEVETEDEKRDRELLECEDSIRSLQCHLRGVLARQRETRKKAQLKLAAPIIARVQAQARGQMSRRVAKAEKQTHNRLGSWATKLQAAAKGHMAEKRWTNYVTEVRRVGIPIVKVQAAARGKLARSRRRQLDKDLKRAGWAFIGLQSQARGRMVRRSFREDKRAIHHPSTVKTFTSMQALLRGRLSRAKVSEEKELVLSHSQTFVSLQSHLRGAIVRRQHRAREEKMTDASDYIVAIQASARGVLARNRKKVFTREAVALAPSISTFQAMLRGRLAKKQHDNMQKALAKVEIAGSVGGLQAFLRTKLAKHKTVEQKKKLEFVQPDVIGFQAVARGHLARREYTEWRDYLMEPYTQGALVFLQSLSRGFIARRKFWMRRVYLYNNQDKIAKVQALWRGRTQRQMYQRLITGGGVDVPTIQHYMHLLDDNENDFRDQLTIDTLRKDVIELVRANQTLDTEVKELDTKIALILKNKMTFEDLARAKRRGVAAGEEEFHNPSGGDPFVSVHLDRASQRKLELYEHLFFTLQTQPQYLSRLLWKLGGDEELEKDCRLVEAVTLILFGFGHDRREEYLFHKLCQLSVHEQILRSRSLEELAATRFSIIGVVTQYAKPELKPYLHNVLSRHLGRIVAADDLDLSTDPVDLYNRLISGDEVLTGIKSDLPRDLTADQILGSHPETRTIYIRHLQELRGLTDHVAKEMMASTSSMPYTIRLLAREVLLALMVKYPDCSQEQLWPVIAKTVIMPFILPAIVAPETYDIIEHVDPPTRRNLSAIATLLGYVAGQDFAKQDRMVQVPLNEYIRAEGLNMRDWILDVAGVDFQVQDLLESTTDAAPISITRNDIYSMLGILIRNSAALTANKNDPIKSVLDELEGPPLDYDKSNKTVRVHLTNRLAQLQPSDPEAARLRELEVQAKRHVLAVLRIQTGKDLFEVLLKHPTAEDEARWVEEVHRDIALEQARLARHDLPPTPAEIEYQLESIRSLPFHEVKARAVEFCMGLVEAGRLSREDHFQGLLVSIAGDIREKHRLRQKRRVDLKSMSEARANLSEKRQTFEEQIQSYHDYIDTSMANLQQKKKAPLFSRQYWHQRGRGKKSKFGSYRYTAAELYEKGILLSVNQFSPRQFDKIHIVIASDKVGVFVLEMSLPTGGVTLDSGAGREELRMEDLLQAQFDNNVRLDLFDGMAAFNLNTLIHQINKKFYAS